MKWLFAIVFMALGTMAQIPVGGITSSGSGKTTLATDNFTQANENPLSSGGNWTVDSDFDAAQVVSHKVENTSTGNQSVEIYTGASFPNDQWQQAKVYGGAACASVSSCDWWAVVRGDGAGTFYASRIDWTSPTWSYQIFKFVSGSPTQLMSCTGAQPADGTLLYVSAQGTSIKMFVGGSQVCTTQTDSSITSGKAGIAIYANPIQTNQMDTWSAGACNGAC